ncbi:MAG: bacteriohemerythrin [Rhodocyclaceae bacterium]|nr:bacteriohemerythrin [Rhodocyclaceae bacterium]
MENADFPPLALLTTVDYAIIFNAASNGMAFSDAETGCILDVNEAWIRASGIARHEAIGKTALALGLWDSPADREAVMEAMDRLGSIVDFPVNLRLKGEVRPHLISAQTVQMAGRNHRLWEFRDITQSKRDEAELRESEARLRTILDSVDAYIYLKDLAGSYLFANAAVRKLWGAEMPEIFGHGDEKFFDAATATKLRQNDSRVLFGGETLRAEETNTVIETGETATYYSVKLPLRRDDGSIYALCGISTDITLRKKAESDLQAHRDHLEAQVAQRTAELSVAKELAEAANNSKSAFLANMSHEIRTPLNAITGMTFLIRRSGVTPQQEERLAKIATASAHLLEVIDGILDLSKIEAGKFSLEEGPVQLESVLANVVAMVKARAEDKGLQLLTRIAVPPTLLLGDTTRLQQGFLNFAVNAIKFTERGRVALSVNVAEEYADHLMVRFQVDDTGIGIEPSAMSRLFTAFEQADNTMTRKYGGTGLGLAITKKLAQQMGGDAGAASVLGEGSSFWFTARLKKGGSTLNAARPGEASVESLLRERYAGSRILLAEDEAINAEVARILLEEVGLVTDIAADGAEALNQVLNQDYALVLMDMQMPVMSGLEATQRIRQLARGKNIPILATTANAFAEDRQRCLAVGMDDFLTKPVEPESFYGTLFKWLSRKRQADSPELRRLNWDDSFSVGDPVMDSHHQKLLELCNRLAECAQPDRMEPDSAFHALLNELNEYAQVHFAAEEAMLRACGYPGVSGQEAEHLIYKAKINELLAKAKTGHLDRVGAHHFVLSWLMQHIFVSDMRYKLYVTDRKTES